MVSGGPSHESLQLLLQCLNLLMLVFIAFQVLRLCHSMGPQPRQNLRQSLASLPLLRSTPWAKKVVREGSESCREAQREHPLSMTLGRGLLSLVDPRNDRNLIHQMGWLRKEIHREIGLVVPGVKFSDSGALDPFEYVVYFNGLELARGRMYPGRFLVLGPAEQIQELADPGWHTHHPVTGESSVWVSEDSLGRVTRLGFLCYEPTEVLAQHLRQTFWQQASSFVTQEYCLHFLNRALELDQGVATRRQSLEPHLPRLRKVLQSLLELGGDLKDPVHVVRVFERNLQRSESPELLGKRILEVPEPQGNSGLDGAVAGAMLYSAHWNEMLCMELFHQMDQKQLVQLTSGLLKMQHYPGPVVERIWFEIGFRSESLMWGRSNQELAEQIRNVLQRGVERAQPMAPLERLAILLLCLPKSSGPVFAGEFIEELTRAQAGELAAFLGRYAPLWSEAPVRPDGRNALEIGLRERVVHDFLDFAARPQWEPCPYDPREMIYQLQNWTRNEPEKFTAIVQLYYFPCVEPIGRFRSLVYAQPRRLRKSLLRYLKQSECRATSQLRAAHLLRLLPGDQQALMVARLKGRGCPVPEIPASERAPVRWLQEFVCRYQAHSPAGRIALNQ